MHGSLIASLDQLENDAARAPPGGLEMVQRELQLRKVTLHLWTCGYFTSGGRGNLKLVTCVWGQRLARILHRDLDTNANVTSLLITDWFIDLLIKEDIIRPKRLNIS